MDSAAALFGPGSIDTRGQETGRGEVSFATADERDVASLRLARAGMLVAELEGIGPSARGRLGDIIDETVERELAARGAPGPGSIASTDRDRTLSDQLFRARRAGASGIAIVLGPLRAAAGASGALDPADCDTLRFLALATRERPMMLLLDARDATTGGYGDPLSLSELLSVSVKAPAATVAKAAPAPAVPLPSPAPPQRPSIEAWHAWTLQLAEARGPQPLTALERIFAQAYVPLTNAIAAGLDDPRARQARDEFRDTFATGYLEAFPTFAATTKRPRMVFDVHDVASRIARLHGARTVRLMLVDSMRWDLSRAIAERLMTKLGARAVLADEMLLWSALPTNTMRQLETIARGVEALRQPSVLEPDPEPPRGRNAEHVRRIRVGSRELHKLDLVESRIQAARAETLRVLPEITEVTAEAIARHVDTLAPRTLLLVFGDHGFIVDKAGVARHGGASPEEVLVGCFSLLVGEVH